MSEFSKLIVEEMNRKGMTRAQLGAALGVSQQAASSWLQPNKQKPERWKEIALAVGVPMDVAERAVNTPVSPSESGTFEQTHVRLSTFKPSANAGKRAPLAPPAAGMIPVIGRAAAGEPGKIIIMDGEPSEWIPCPPELIGVDGGYATYVYGDSMEPRYFNGERVYVHPSRPYGPKDFVVAQVRDDDDNLSAYVKRFVSYTAQGLKLHQYNPDDDLEFAPDAVDAVHLIVGSGRG